MESIKRLRRRVESQRDYDISVAYDALMFPVILRRAWSSDLYVVVGLVVVCMDSVGVHSCMNMILQYVPVLSFSTPVVVTIHARGSVNLPRHANRRVQKSY